MKLKKEEPNQDCIKQSGEVFMNADLRAFTDLSAKHQAEASEGIEKHELCPRELCKRSTLMKTIKYIFVIHGLLAMFLRADIGDHSGWLQRKDGLKQDRSVARHYTFEDVKDSKSIIKELKGSGADLTFVPFPSGKEKIDDLQVIEGRWPGKSAVRIDRGWYQGRPVDIENKEFSVEVWFRKNGQGSISHHRKAAPERADGAIMATSNGSQKGWRLVTVYNQRHSLEFFMGSQPPGIARVHSYLSMPDGVWQHLTATWDGREMKTYLNGMPAGSKQYQGPYVPSEEGDFFKIGYIKAGVGSIILDIDEIVIYNRVLSAQEIEKLGKGQADSISRLFSSADAFIKGGNYKLARAEYEKLKNVPGIDYGEPMALFNIAESYIQEKDYANAHSTYAEIYAIPGLTAYYRIYGLFREAEVYMEQENYETARQLYGQITKTSNATGHHIFNALLRRGDTYKAEKIYSSARKLYEELLIKEESSLNPHETRRLELRNRLEEIEGLPDGTPARKSADQLMAERINKPGKAIYVSVNGSDANPGTMEKPFATIKRAQKEVRNIKEGNMPAGGIAVYIRGGNYFLDQGIALGKEDSGTESRPAVYRSNPGEEVRLIGGRQVKNFTLLENPDILKKLPEEARGRVWTADLKAAGITQYGELLNRGGHSPTEIARPGALEVIFNGKIMTLARWPNTGYVKIAGIPDPKGDGVFRNKPFQNNMFIYSGDRPNRWTDEKEVWIKGYLAETMPYQMIHVKMTNLDTKKKMIETAPDTRWGEKYPLYNTLYQQGGPYYAYNFLSEIDSPGEWYLDRDESILYLWPPEDINRNEVIVTTLDKPVVSFHDASHVTLAGVTVEGTWTHGIEIEGGENNLIAGCVIRNTGQYAVNIKGGWNHGIFGCDMYDMGEGGVLLAGGDHKRLIPSGHLVKNNHIHHFNRFCGGYRPAALLMGTGHRVSHNLIHDSPHHAIYIRGASEREGSSNDHVIEFNELHDVPHEAREMGTIYINSGAWRLQNRGNIIRNNFFHHISYHSSPNIPGGLNAIHIDSLNGGFAVTDNFFYLVPNGIANPQPDNRIENNIFVNPEQRAVSQGNRAFLFNDMDNETPKEGMLLSYINGLNAIKYKQPPWSYRYPQLLNSLSGHKMIGWAGGNVIEHNVNNGGPFLSVAPGIMEDNTIRNNWEAGDPLFINSQDMDFRIRKGSPVYGTTDYEPAAFKNIGVYDNEFRASWPVERKKEDIGKYYRTEWKEIDQIAKTQAAHKRVSKALEYTIKKASVPIKIDGKLDREEWLGLDKKNAMVIEQYHTGEQKEGPESYAWILYDDTNLYVAAMHAADPYMESMPSRMKNHLPISEIAIETQHGRHSWGWWIDDMPTGPIYSFWVRPEGKCELKNIYGMPHEAAEKIEKSVECCSIMQDAENMVWVSEMKIPLASIGLMPEEAGQLSFNMGVWKRNGWFAWVATGGKINQLETAGYIRFAK